MDFAASALFVRVFHKSPVPIAITTFVDGRFLEVNDSFLRQTGYERTEVIGRTAGEFPIPVAIVPGHLTDEELDALS